MVFNIISSSGPGGTIEPSGSIPVVAGTEKTFKITPGTGTESRMFWSIISHMVPFQNTLFQM